MSDFSQAEPTKAAETTVEKGSVIRTGGWGGFGKPGEVGYQHEAIPTKHLSEDAARFPAVHTLISNARAWIGGTFPGIGPQYMQVHFDEFCYRFNRRRDKAGLFTRLMRAYVQARPVTLLQVMLRSTVPAPRLVMKGLAPRNVGVT